MNRQLAKRLGIGLIGVTACTSKPNGTLALTTGGETDTFSRAPAPTTLVVDFIDAAGNATNITKAKLPADTVDLGDRDEQSIGSIRVHGTDDAGNVLVTGTSFPLQFGALDGLSIPIFVQRANEMARMPAPLASAREAPLVQLVVGRYVFVAGGADAAAATTTEIYDVATLSLLPSPPTLARPPRSIAALGTKLLIVDDGGATWLELADNTTTAATAPAGGKFAEIAGGATVEANDGTSYVVGATRTQGDPTARVLRVAADGTLSFVALSAARAGAAAVWIEGRGLVVAGGSSSAPGVEVVAAGATSSAKLAFPPDPIAGGGASQLDATHVLLAGGADPGNADPAAGGPPRVVDLGCGNGCAAAPWNVTMPRLATAQLRRIDDTSALAVGDDASGASHAFVLRSTEAREVPFKAPRRGARAVRLLAPAIAVIGGAAPIESFGF